MSFTIPQVTMRAGETRAVSLDVSAALPDGVGIQSAGTVVGVALGALADPPALTLGAPTADGSTISFSVAAPQGAAGEVYRLGMTWTTDGGEVLRSLMVLRVT